LLILSNRVKSTGSEESHSTQGIGIVWSKYIARQLRPHEFLVGQVAIQGINHPIAIGPGIGPKHVLMLAADGLASESLGDLRVELGLEHELVDVLHNGRVFNQHSL